MGLFGGMAAALGSKVAKKFKSGQSDTSKPFHTHSSSKETGDGASVGNDPIVSAGLNSSSTQPRSGGRPELNQGIPVVPSNGANNNYTNPGVQKLGSEMWEGESLARDLAHRRMTASEPTPLPGKEYTSSTRMDEAGTPLMQINYPHTEKKYTYKKGDLMDETDHEENEYKSTNEGKIKGTRYNTENVSDIQEDNKGQFMTTLGDDESYDPDSPRPTSSRVTSYDQGRNAVRDTLRPAKGKQFVSSWKLNK